MRIDRLELQNFKKFEEASFDFPLPVIQHGETGSVHILIGENGSGKTSVLDALAVALGVWLVKVPDSSLANSRRPIASSEKRLEVLEQSDRDLVQEASGDVVVRAIGSIGDEPLEWEQRIKEGNTRTSNSGAKRTLEVIQESYKRAKANESVTLPVIAYYGAGRTWLPHRERSKSRLHTNGPSRRWAAFYDCLNERVRLSDLTSWFETETLAASSRGGTHRPGFQIVYTAVLRAIPEANDLWFDADRREIMFSIGQTTQPLPNLSAGQKTMLAMVADIAIKAVTQNNFLVPPDYDSFEKGPLPLVLQKTPGVILIDELDVHLHPKWQRSVVESLRSTFPAMQFIATTHSPFIIQSLQEYELINLEGQSVPQLGNLGVGLIAEGLMGVERADVSLKYREMVDAAKSYLSELEKMVDISEEELDEFEESLAKKISPYADNPAFQAFLELKRDAKSGSKSKDKES